MKERVAGIATTDGRMKTFITHPEQDGPFPAVVLYMDFWGVREELFDIARKIGTVGYYCMVPDFYYRQGEIHNQRRNAEGRMISLDRLDEETRKAFLAPLAKLSNQMAMEDTAALLDFVAKGEPVRPGAKGSIGYCLGGRLVMCAAGHFPDHFRASASLHGSALVSDAADSPHRMTDKFRGELYCGFAEHDPYTSPATVNTLQASMRNGPVKYFYEIHRGAEHGYALPDRDIHDKRAANRDWELIFAMFRRQIPPGAGASGG
jgi:carboxymethylenebutenolidase